jgi:hypothetical protein
MLSCCRRERPLPAEATRSIVVAFEASALRRDLGPDVVVGARDQHHSNPTTHRHLRSRRPSSLAQPTRRGTSGLATLGHRPHRARSATPSGKSDPRRGEQPRKPRMGRARHSAPCATDDQHRPTPFDQTTHTRTRHRHRDRLTVRTRGVTCVDLTLRLQGREIGSSPARRACEPRTCGSPPVNRYTGDPVRSPSYAPPPNGPAREVCAN